MSDFDALLLAVVGVVAGGGWLACRGVLTITVRRPTGKPPRSVSGVVAPPRHLRNAGDPP